MSNSLTVIRWFARCVSFMHLPLLMWGFMGNTPNADNIPLVKDFIYSAHNVPILPSLICDICSSLLSYIVTAARALTMPSTGCTGTRQTSSLWRIRSYIGMPLYGLTGLFLYGPYRWRCRWCHYQRHCY